MTYINIEPTNYNAHNYSGDCTIISVGNALDISYDLSLLLLQHLDVDAITNEWTITNKKKTKAQFSNYSDLRRILGIFSNETVHLSMETLSIERSNGPFQRRSRASATPSYKALDSFADIANSTKQTHFVLSHNHIAVTHGGELIDGWDSRKSKVMSSFKVNKTKAHVIIKELMNVMGVDKKHFKYGTLNKKIKAHKNDLPRQVEVPKGLTLSRETQNTTITAKMPSTLNYNETPEYFNAHSRRMGLTPDMYGQEIEVKGSRYTVIGVNTNRPKYSFTVYSHEDEARAGISARSIMYHLVF